LTVQGHQLAQRGGAAPLLPLSNREQEWTPRPATLLYSPPCRSFAQALPGLWITLFSARPFLRSAQLGFSAQPRGTGADFHQESIAVQTSSMNTMAFKS
jgi:hypothetical protein